MFLQFFLFIYCPSILSLFFCLLHIFLSLIYECSKGLPYLYLKLSNNRKCFPIRISLYGVRWKLNWIFFSFGEGALNEFLSRSDIDTDTRLKVNQIFLDDVNTETTVCSIVFGYWLHVYLFMYNIYEFL